MNRLTLFFLTIFFFCLSNDQPLQAGLLNVSDAAKQLRITSLKQTVVENRIIFEGEVEVLIDQTMHLWADRIEVDQEKNLLTAEKISQGPVVIENKDFVILTDRFVLNLDKKTGYAEKMKIHLVEGYISASRAEKLGENEWCMRHIKYTACDADRSHWSLSARKAMVHGGYFIRVTGVLFKIGRIPIFALPKMAFPIQGKSRSGFLIPRFYLDYDYGFGIKQEYYQHFKSRCDTTFGVNWQARKGFVLFDEFRWARAADNFTIFNSHYARANHEFVERDVSIEQSLQQHYWVSGQNFQKHGQFKGMFLNSLVRADFGTDKRVGYQFFNRTEDVDDSFYNTGIMRCLWPYGQLELKVDSIDTSRKRFIDASGKERQVIVSLAQLPRLEWSTSYYLGSNWLFYRHDCFFDQALFREQELEKQYVQSRLIQEKLLVPLQKAHVLRADYHGSINTYCQLGASLFHASFNPHVQVRNVLAQDLFIKKNAYEQRLFAHGVARLYGDFSTEWALPEYACYRENGSYIHSFQPVLRGVYVPHFMQDHWYFMDKWDRVYPQKKLEFALRNNINIKHADIDIAIAQGYDFYDQSILFPLQRGTQHNNHLLPLQLDMTIASDYGNFLMKQEYGLQDRRLLSLEALIGIQKGKNKVEFGYLFQQPKLEMNRELLSHIPHFFLLGVSFQVGEHGLVHYGGQFYSERGRHFLELNNIKPLLHAISFEYSGHCWGFYVGFEEKRYREYGNNKHERTIVFSLRFDSLGSFAKKFRQPNIIHESSE